MVRTTYSACLSRSDGFSSAKTAEARHPGRRDLFAGEHAGLPRVGNLRLDADFFAVTGMSALRRVIEIGAGRMGP
jgi:hypothetical protein